MSVALEIIEPLSPAESNELQRLEFIIQKSQKHVDNWIEAARQIRDQRLYRGEFTTFADYCETRLKKAVRSVQLALQLNETRKDVAQSLRINSDQQTQAHLTHASANAVSELVKLPKQKRASVFDAASKRNNRTPTAKDIKQEAARQSHRPGSDARDYSGAYTSAPNVRTENPEHVCQCKVCGKRMTT